MTNLGAVVALRGDARHLPMPDACVDLIVTSPPYWALRSYTDGGGHYAGQIGAEPTPGEYVDNLIACTREWMRVLKPSGSIWVNLGDKYSGAGRGNNQGERLTNPVEVRAARYATLNRRQHAGLDTAPAKSLIGLPWRYALRCIDELGLILRAEVIWSKPNGLPESVTDRVRRSHEQWFHLVRQPRYYSAVDEIREAHTPVSLARSGRNRFAIDRSQEGIGSPNTVNPQQACNPLGKLPGSVWTIATEPLSVPDHLGVDHFAAFPTEWPRRIILGWSPSGICTGCGEGRRPTSERDRVDPALIARRGQRNVKLDGMSRAAGQPPLAAGSLRRVNVTAGESPATHITGYACACPDTTAPTRPSVVLDPFGGTGTTALVAHALGRVGVSVDMSADYCRLAQWRTTDRRELAKAMRVERPAPVVENQLAFDLLEMV